MTLPTPSTQLGEAQILIAVRALLSNAALLPGYLSAQVTGLASAGVTVTLPTPRTVAIGTWDSWRIDTDGAPALLIYIAGPTQWTPDDAGGTYQCETMIGVGIALTEGDIGGTTPGAVYLASVAYAQAVAYCLQRWLSSASWGGPSSIWDCVIQQTGAEAAPIPDSSGTLYRLSETTHLVRWQAIQQAPEQP